MRTLLIDDDPAFRRLASLALTEAGVEHVCAATSNEALELIERDRRHGFDLILLDHELPGMDGPELLRHLRRLGHDVPVVLVTVRDDVSERIRALQDGADDYVVKPFQFRELVARLRAVVRRSRGAGPIRIGSLEIDPRLRRVEHRGREVRLTPREFDLLYVLTQAQDRTVSRKELLQRVWRMSFEPGTNFIQVHMSKLRMKLRAAGAAIDGFRIRTIRSQGYRLVSCPLAVRPGEDAHPRLPVPTLPADG